MFEYLICESDKCRIVPANEVRNVIDNGIGDIRIFRLCGLNDPLELYLRFFGNAYIVEDRFGNMEVGL